MSHSTPLKPPVSGFIRIGSEVLTGTRSVPCCYHHLCVRLAEHVLSWSCRSDLLLQFTQSGPKERIWFVSVCSCHDVTSSNCFE